MNRVQTASLLSVLYTLKHVAQGRPGSRIDRDRLLTDLDTLTMLARRHRTKTDPTPSQADNTLIADWIKGNTIEGQDNE